MIRDNVQNILKALPRNVKLVAVAKGRTAFEILQAIEGGVKIVGENYVQQAGQAYKVIGNKAQWHFIGHLQKNKLKKAIEIFDLIETVDSYSLAQEINRLCSQKGKVMPVLVEVNSGREKQKFGVLPEEVERLIEELSHLKNIKVKGLMTMGPRVGRAELARAYFVKTKQIFDIISALNIGGVEMSYLSMGMSNTYQIAVEEGANIVRIGSKIFGEREEQIR